MIAIRQWSPLAVAVACFAWVAIWISVFAPPLVIEPPQIELIGERLEQALDDVAIELKNDGSLR